MAIFKYLDISTAHVKKKTLNPDIVELGNGCAYRKGIPNCIAEYPEGAFFHLGSYLEQGMTDDLFTVIQYARDQGCDYLRLDADGDVIDELPVYDW